MQISIDYIHMMQVKNKIKSLKYIFLLFFYIYRIVLYEDIMQIYVKFIIEQIEFMYQYCMKNID